MNHLITPHTRAKKCPPLVGPPSHNIRATTVATRYTDKLHELSETVSATVDLKHHVRFGAAPSSKMESWVQNMFISSSHIVLAGIEQQATLLCPYSYTYPRKRLRASVTDAPFCAYLTETKKICFGGAVLRKPPKRNGKVGLESKREQEKNRRKCSA